MVTGIRPTVANKITPNEVLQVLDLSADSYRIRLISDVFVAHLNVISVIYIRLKTITEPPL